MHLASMFGHGKRVALVGVGGGSDCVQAAMLAKLSDKSACVISIRTQRTGSQSATSKIGEARMVINHGGEVCEGVYRIIPATTGSGRFLEMIPAELGLPSYLVIDRHDGALANRICSALLDFGTVDALYGIDTGGDSLYRTTIADKARATPEQDLASLRALAALGLKKFYSVIVAQGVDSPPYVAEVLATAKAVRIMPSAAERQTLLSLYKSIRMDGSDDTRFGKTALAWQAALRRDLGPVRLKLPAHLVDDARNAWNPIVTITDEMACAYRMKINDHLSALMEMP